MCVKIRTYVCDVYVCLLLGLGGGLYIGFLLDGGLVIQLLLLNVLGPTYVEIFIFTRRRSSLSAA